VRRSFPRPNPAGGKDVGSRRTLCNQRDNDGSQRDLEIERQERVLRNEKFKTEVNERFKHSRKRRRNVRVPVDSRIAADSQS
jgi:hypothetical protein